MDPSRHLVEPLSCFSSFNVPNLSILDIKMSPNASRIELMKKFLRTKLTRCSFTLWLPRMVPEDTEREVLAALRTMPLSNMTHFSMAAGCHLTHKLYPDLLEILRNKASLREVVLPPTYLSAKNLNILLGNSSLTAIKGRDSEDTTQTAFEWPVLYYSDRSPVWYEECMRIIPQFTTTIPRNLTYLTVSTTMESAMSLIVDVFDTAALTSFSLILVGSSTPAQTAAFSRALSGAFRHLRQFRLSQVPPFVAEDDDLSFPLSWDSLRPLRTCSHMEEVEIFWYGRLIINDEDVKELAASWQRLKTLLTRSYGPSRVVQEASISLDCLLSLAQHCLSLQKLSLHVSLTLSNEVWVQQEKKLFPNMRVVVFDLALPVPQPTELAIPRLAQRLAMAFPKTCMVTCPWLEKDMWGSTIRYVEDMSHHQFPGGLLSLPLTHDVDVAALWGAIGIELGEQVTNSREAW